MEINGKKIKFKITKKKNAANFEKAVNEMAEKEKQIREMNETSLGEVLDSLKNMFRDFFVTATGEDVIDDCDDVEEMEEMYNEFLEEVMSQKEKLLSGSKGLK